MAILKQSVIGKLSGKIGDLVGASWKGISVLKVAPASVADPKTDRQLEQRQKFGVCIKFLQPLTQFLKTGFKDYAVRMTAFNAAMAYTIKNALLGTYPNFTINYPTALVTRGALAPALDQAAASTVAGTILFTWTDNSDESGANPFDKNLLVIYNPVKNQAVTFSELGTRADATQAVTVPHSFSGDLVHCYIAFITVDGQMLSNSKYAGAITVA